MNPALLYVDVKTQTVEHRDFVLRAAKGLRERGFQIAFFIPDKTDLAAQIDKECFSFFPYEKGIASLMQLRRFLKQHPVDLIHVHSANSLQALMMVACLSGVRCVLPYDHKLSWPMSRLAVNLPKVPVGVETEALIPSPEKGLAFRKKLGLTKNQFVVGAPSLEEVETVLNAAIFLKSHQRLRWLIVGEKAKYSSRLKKMGLEGRVFFTGAMQNLEGPFQAMDVALFTGSNRRDPDLLAMQAACTATPLITTRIPGFIEICHDHLTGYTVDSHNAHQIASHVLHLMDDSRGCFRMGKEARAHVLSKFTWKHTINFLEQSYLSAHHRL